jgi:hypothetical protein
VQQAYTKELLEKQGKNQFLKVENANFNEVLTLSRMDEALKKVFMLKLRAKQNAQQIPMS